jgi:hypothetical protein
LFLKLDPSPVANVRASGVVFTVSGPAWSWICVKSRVSLSSCAMLVKSMSSAGALAQISIGSPPRPSPLSESWYWYWKGSLDGTCTSTVQAERVKPRVPAGLPSKRKRK